MLMLKLYGKTTSNSAFVDKNCIKIKQELTME